MDVVQKKEREAIFKAKKVKMTFMTIMTIFYYQ